MARLPRFTIPGQPQHVFVRCNNRSEIFCADSDYRFYLEKLQAACEKHGCDIHAYVLMTNHVHFLVTPHDEHGVSKAIQMLGRYYVQYYNYCYQRTGTLWEGRYKATLIDSERYLLTCMRYIELNPVRAGLAASPELYRWSSYRRNGRGDDDPLLGEHAIYTAMGREPAERQAAYRALFRAELDEHTVADIRAATHSGHLLAAEGVRRQAEASLGQPLGPAPRGRPPRKNKSTLTPITR